LGTLNGPVGTVQNGDLYVLSVGAFGDTAAGDGGGTVFFDDGGDFTAANAPTGENFVGWNAGGAGPYALRLNGCKLQTTGSKGCDFEIGDVNQDGLITLLDVNPFVAILIGGGFQCEADINEDGSVTLTDVDPFVALLTGG
jgi:hypothetical protein